MTYYEIINPSDTYTLKADDPKIAIIVAVLLGGGKYGLRDEQDAEILPIFIFDGLEVWLQVTHGCTLTELFDRADKEALAACFNSVAICPLKDRPLWDKAVEAMEDPVKREAWLAKWHDTQRSSMNDIGARAKHYARSTRAKFVEPSR